MAEKIIIEYGANVNGLKADLKTVQTELKATEQTATTAADNTTQSFNKTTESTKSLRTQLKDLKAQLANATDPKDIERLAKAAGKLTDQIEDATDAAKVFASESKFEQIGNAFGSVVSKLRNLDFSGAVQQSKLLVATSKSLTFKEAVGGVKDLGATLLNVGKSLLLNPIFLIGAAVTGIIANFEKLKNSGGIIGTVFTAIGDAIGWVVDKIEEAANAIGLIDTETAAFYDKLTERALRNAKAQEERLDLEIRLKQAAGKETVAQEILKQKAIINTANLEFQLIKDRIKATGEFTDEQKERIAELGATIKKANEDILVIEAKSNADKLKKQAETNKKILEEANALNKALRDLTTQNIQGNYAREKQLLDNKLADDIEKYKNNAKIREQLEIKYQNDLKALDKKFIEDWYNEKMPSIEKGEQDVADIRIQETIKANNAILAKLKETEDKEVKDEQERIDRRKANLTAFINFAQQALSTYQQLYNDSVNAEIQANQEAKDENLALLQEEYDNKLISQQIYEARKKKINEDALAKERELKQEQFERNKQISIINATIAQAQAIAGALAQSKELGAGAFVLAGLMAILGAAQITAIASQPTPKFEKGGWIDGKRHSQGGTIIEAEKDEFVINRNDAMRHSSLLEAINSGNADDFINKHYIAPILKEQQRKYKEAKESTFADNIVNSMLLNSGQFKDENLLESLKRSRQSDKENAMYIVKELTKRTRNPRSW